MNTSLFRLLISSNLLILLTCCSYKVSRLPSPWVYRALPPHIREVLEGDPVPRALRGIAKVRIDSPDKKFSVREVVVIQSPHYLRMETLNPLGQPEFFVVTNGHELSFFSPSENRYYYGTASPENMARLISAALGVEEIVSLMLGGVVLREYDREKVEYREKGTIGVVRLLSLENGRVQTLTVEHSRQRVVECVTWITGGKELRARYSNYEEIGGRDFPKEIEIILPRDRARVKVNYQQVELLTEVDPFEFTLSPPSGVELISLD